MSDKLAWFVHPQIKIAYYFEKEYRLRCVYKTKKKKKGCKIQLFLVITQGMQHRSYVPSYSLLLMIKLHSFCLYIPLFYLEIDEDHCRDILMEGSTVGQIWITINDDIYIYMHRVLISCNPSD